MAPAAPWWTGCSGQGPRNSAAMASICISASRRLEPSIAWIWWMSASRFQDGNELGALASLFGCSSCVGMRLDIFTATPVWGIRLLTSARPRANRYIRLGERKTGCLCATAHSVGVSPDADRDLIGPVRSRGAAGRDLVGVDQRSVTSGTNRQGNCDKIEFGPAERATSDYFRPG